VAEAPITGGEDSGAVEGSAAVGEAASGEGAKSSLYLVSPLFDCLNFLYMPLIALAIGAALSHAPFARQPMWVNDETAMFPHMLAIAIVTAAHLSLVFVRSHANPEVFKRHPWRFTLVPLALGIALYSSLWLSALMVAVAIWWDLYHSSMQTFGLARLYERKAGNDVEVGRSLDMWLNILLYAGPILGGATLVNHIRMSKFEGIAKLSGQNEWPGVEAFFKAIPAQAKAAEGTLTYVLLGIGVPFLCYYVYRYWRLAQQGHRVSYPKVLLLVSTGVTSIYSWGFNSFGQAFFIMNLFHAWQYFAIVWWVEGGNVRKILRLDTRPYLGTAVALALFIGLPLVYGTIATVGLRNTNNVLFCVAMVVTIMHFWYDGFVWSVRKSHV
jgi:hypothetical protein